MKTTKKNDETKKETNNQREELEQEIVQMKTKRKMSALMAVKKNTKMIVMMF